MLYEIEAKMQKGKNGISFYYRLLQKRSVILLRDDQL